MNFARLTCGPRGKRELFNVDRTGLQPMGKEARPHWSPDGQWLVFSSDRHINN
jgi:Tol biopolymer transport system component